MKTEDVDGDVAHYPIKLYRGYEGDLATAETVRRMSREKYGKPRAEIERKLRAFYDYRKWE